MIAGGKTMSKKFRKSITSFALGTVLILGAAFTVNAGVEQGVARSNSNWYIDSKPGGDSSYKVSDIRGGSRLYVFTYNYKSEPTAGRVVRVTSPQSPDTLGINSTALRTMGYSSTTKVNDRIDVTFYAYSSVDRILANGSIDA